MNTLSPEPAVEPTAKNPIAIEEASRVEESSRAKTSNSHHEPNFKMSAFQRLNIGPVSAECLKNSALKAMVDPTWTHLGGEPVKPILEKWASKWHSIRQRIKSIRMANSNRVLSDEKIKERTCFQPFHYEIGARIDLPDSEFSFIYSENYFQRFFMDEADGQFRECFRLLEEGGVLRIAVPDADLRTYESTEPVGFPQNLRWESPAKHKTRWSIYSLGYALENCGYHVRPIAWCDKQGHYQFQPPSSKDHAYQNTADTRFAFDMSYCANIGKSLIVDAVKPTADEIVPRGHLVSLLHPIEKN